VGHLGEMIVDAVGDGRRFGLDVHYVHDGAKLLGTGGAIAHALPVIGDRFLILYGDSYLDTDYQEVAAAFLASGKPALMTVYANAGRWDTSNVEYDGHKIICYSKTARNERMCHIDYGLGAAHKSIFEALPHGIAIELAAIYERLASEDMLAAFEVFRRFYEIGSTLGIQELEAKLLGQAKE
jgi:NDP-sugar pyrophosphorylase family protein